MLILKTLFVFKLKTSKCKASRHFQGLELRDHAEDCKLRDETIHVGVNEIKDASQSQQKQCKKPSTPRHFLSRTRFVSLTFTRLAPAQLRETNDASGTRLWAQKDSYP